MKQIKRAKKILGHKALRGLFLISFAGLSIGGYFKAQAQGAIPMSQAADLQEGGLYRELRGVPSAQTTFVSHLSERQALLPVLFYSVEKDGKTHYLFGSQHAPIPIQNLACHKRIERAIQNSDQLFLETSVTDIYEEIFEKVFPPSFYPAKVEALKPGFFAPLESIIDSQIEKLANSLSVPTVNLDNRELHYQLGNMEDIEFSLLLVKDLMPSLSEEDIEGMFSARVASLEAYHRDYLQGLLELLTGNNLRSQNIDHNIYLIDRHKIWRTKFLQAHDDPKNNSLFLVAGMRHFIGSHNFIDMLSEDGFLVQRMDCGLNEFLSAIEEDNKMRPNAATAEDDMSE